MSAAEEGEMNMTCAFCGIAEVDIKLMDCNGCDLVKYCSDECQEDHRPNHEEECKKRAAELRDKILFKQPESSHLGDCPICCLPLPIDLEKIVMSCCSKVICNGCYVANKKREAEGRLQCKCSFCRKALLKTEEEHIERLMKRVEVDDPVAMYHIGRIRYNEGDYEAAFEYWTRAAELGNVESHFHLSILYGNGRVVEKDEERKIYHLIEAAIGGHPGARHNLGWAEEQHDRMDRAAKHWIIAANLGDDDSLEAVKILYKHGYVSKEDFAAALRGHYAAIVAMKSPQREEAAVFLAERDRRSI